MIREVMALRHKEVKMIVVAIRDRVSGNYYAGCNKNLAQTLLGAQLYKSRKVAENVVRKSINFNITYPESSI